MKKFRVLLVDARTGYDIYENFYCYAESLVELAIRLENSRVSFRLIEDVTKQFAGVQYFFTPSPWPPCDRAIFS